MARGSLEAGTAPATATSDVYRIGKVVGPLGEPRTRYTTAEGGPRKTRDPQGKEKDIGESTTGIPLEMRENYHEFARNELSKLLTLANGTAEQQQKYNLMINHPAYEPFKAVLDKFSTLRPGSEEAGVPIRTLNLPELENYMTQTREGFLDAYELRWISLGERTKSRGVKLSDNLPPSGPERIEDQDISTGRGGPLRGVARDVSLYFGRRLTTYGRNTPSHTPVTRRELPTYGAVTEFLATVSTKSGAVGAALGAVIGGPPGAIAGGAAGIAMPIAIAGLVHAFHEGERVTIRQVRSALETVNEGYDPVRRLWAQEMYNTASTNREVRGGEINTGRDILRGRQLARPEMSADKALSIITAEQNSLTDAQAAMGIPRELRGATSNWFSPPDSNRGRDRRRSLADRQFVQRDMPLEITTEETLMHELRYRQNGLWVPCQVEVDPLGVPLAAGAPRTGLWEDNVGQYRYAGGAPMPAFDLRYLLTNANEIQEQRDTIHRRLFTERFRLNMNRFDEIGKERIDLLGLTITKRREAHAQEGAIAKERTAATDEQDRILTEDKNGLQSEIDSLTAITTDLNNITDERRAQNKARNKVTGAIYPPGVPVPADRLQILNDLLTENAPDYSITVRHENVLHNIRQSVAYSEAQEVTRHDTRITTIAGTVYANPRGETQATQAEFELHEANMARITRQRTILEAVQQEIVDAQQNVETAQQTLSTKADRVGIQEITRGLETARNTMMSWNTPALPGFAFVGIDLSQAALSEEADPSGNPVFDVLMRRMNDVYALSTAPVPPGPFVPPGPNAGWPAEENDRPERRMTVLHGMAEARAARVQPLIATTPLAFTQAINTTVGAAPGDVSGWNIREVDILVMSRSQLEDLFRQREAEIVGSGRIPPIPPGAPPGYVHIPGTIPNAADIEELQQNAQQRFQSREQRIRELSNEIDGRQKILANEKKRILEEVARTPELDFIDKMRSRIGQIGTIITTMTEAELIRNLDPAPPDPRITRPYEMALRTPGAPPTTGADIFFAELVSGSRTDDLEHRSAAGVVTRGNLGAWNRAREYTDPDIVMQEQNDFFGLQVPGGGPPFTPDEAWNAIRTGLADGTITKERFAEFTINRWVLWYMGQRAAVA